MTYCSHCFGRRIPRTPPRPLLSQEGDDEGACDGSPEEGSEMRGAIFRADDFEHFMPKAVNVITQVAMQEVTTNPQLLGTYSQQQEFLRAKKAVQEFLRAKKAGKFENAKGMNGRR